MSAQEAVLRQRLWTTRLKRHLAHKRVVIESRRCRALWDEVHDVVAEARRLRRRARWLVRTGRPLPHAVRAGK
jgi:hypothetical protein